MTTFSGKTITRDCEVCRLAFTTPEESADVTACPACWGVAIILANSEVAGDPAEWGFTEAQIAPVIGVIAQEMAHT